MQTTWLPGSRRRSGEVYGVFFFLRGSCNSVIKLKTEEQKKKERNGGNEKETDNKRADIPTVENTVLLA